MTLSRTARILLAILLLAAAVFVWVNFFTTEQTQLGQPAAVVGQNGTSTDDAAAAGTPTDAAGDGSAVLADGAVPADATLASEDGEGDEGGDGDEAGAVVPLPSTTEGGNGSGPPTVVAPSNGEVVGRDVEVAEFPFLVTEPPPEEDPEVLAASQTQAGRPGGGRRASVNPFSPILVQAPPEPAAPEVEEVQVQQVDVPEAPEVQEVAQPTRPDAPAPRPLAPSSPRTTGLPRALPGGTLPVAPEPLRSARTETASRAPENIAQLAAVRTPDADDTRARSPLSRPAPRGTGGAQAAGEPAPLAPGAVPAAAQPDDPLVAGSNPLSRYLRDRNVTFTGSVLGSVGVGVFRVMGTNAPVVVSLGQTLPESDIVLTDLRGQEAEFTLGDTSQVLNLDLRR